MGAFLVKLCFHLCNEITMNIVFDIAHNVYITIKRLRNKQEKYLECHFK